MRYKFKTMASVKYLIQTKGKKLSNIYCRFMVSDSIDIKARTNVFVNYKHWDSRHEKIKNVLDVKNRSVINRKLAELKIEVIDEFNSCYLEGEIIDRFWLENVILKFLKRPKDEKKLFNSNHSIYYSDFADWWLKNKSKTWLVSSDNYMNETTRKQYRSFLSLVRGFEGKSKIKLANSGFNTITSFVAWMHNERYESKTIKRHAARFKFFFNRAKEEGYKIDESFNKRIFVPKSKEVLEPFFNEREIKMLFDTEIKDEKLDNARDNLIIACYTGLRISDFNNKLDTSNFIDDFIEITTQKTGKPVVIPVHSIVKRILIKRNGQLPEKMYNSDFNRQIKIVCKMAGMTDLMEGKLFDTKEQRKVFGVYEKYKLVSSHIGRRSFATNLFGKIDLTIISSILGHSTTKQTELYIKKSNREKAIELKEYWKKQEQHEEING